VARRIGPMDLPAGTAGGAVETTMRITGWAREVLERPQRFATLATLAPDGAPFQAVVWYTLRGDVIVVNSAVGRRWPANLVRDPRFSFVVEDGYDWVGVRGLAEPLSDQAEAQADIAAMARRYHADDPGHAESLIRERFQRQERISFLLHAQAVSEHPDS
jgi:PPOX class probable F420-dependent enzyme